MKPSTSHRQIIIAFFTAIVFLFLLSTCAQTPGFFFQPTATPTLTPTPTPTPYFGLAMAQPPADDANRLGVSWYYVWGPASGFDVKAEFVPMLWDGLPDDKIPPDYTGWLLVLNEPNVEIQANLTPEEASRRLSALRAHYPNAQLLCCGQSVWAVDWLQEFLAAGDIRPDAYHVHAYTEAWITPPKAQAFITQMHDLSGGDYWITEFGSPDGKLEDFQAITRWFTAQPWITRIAPYTNRQEQGAWWAIGSGVELFDANGSLTPIGTYYHDVIHGNAP